MNASKLAAKCPTIYCILKEIKQYYRDKKYDIHWKKIPESEYQNIIDKRFTKVFGKPVNWNNPTTYSEKIQWDKLYNKDERKTLLSDKYKVREWVATKIGEEYLVPLLGAWRTTRDIPWKDLPQSFVLKTNKGSGDVNIVKSKDNVTKLEKNLIYGRLRSSMRKNYAFSTCFEMQYSDISPYIIAEKYIGDNIQDYKFLCFEGQPYYCWVDVDRFTDHRRNIYDLEWNKCDWSECYPTTDTIIPKPANFNQMIKIVKRLCRDFPHVRVDLYNINGKIYFGEMTFSSGSGFEYIDPPEMNLYLGSLWHQNS